MTTRLTNRDRNPALTSLRAIAVAMVFAHHIGALTPATSSWLHGIAVIGDVGVAVFFVLSGMLIVEPYLTSSDYPGRTYFAHRALRTLPAYGAVFLALLGFGAFTFTNLTDLFAHAFLLNSFVPTFVFSGITQAWSLTVELCFYALVPLIVMALRWLRPRIGAARAGLVVVGSLFLLGHAWRALVYSTDWHLGTTPIRGMSFLWLPSHIDLFAIGIAIPLFAHSIGASVRRLILAGGFISLAAYGVLLGAPSVGTGYSFGHLEARQLCYGWFGLSLVYGARTMVRTGFTWRVLAHPALVKIGAISYGIYLIHFDILKVLAGRSARTAIWQGSISSPWQLAAIGAVGSLVVAAILERLVERPALAFRNGSLTSERDRLTLSVMMVGGVLVAVIAGLWRYQGPSMEEGFMLVFPEQLLHGRLPHRDFLHLYGPGSLWVLAGAFRLFGTRIEIERIVGLLAHLGLGFGLLAALRHLGHRIAVIGAALGLVIIVGPLGASAMAWNMAIAAGAIGAGFAAWLISNKPTHTWPYVVFGALMGAAVLFRLDVVLAATAAVAVTAASLGARRRVQIVGGYAFGGVGYLALFATSGWGASINGLVTEPVVKLRAGRSLPIPPSWNEVDGFLQRVGLFRTVGWPFAHLDASHQIALWFWLVLILAAALAISAWALPRRTRNTEARLDVRAWLPLCMFAVFITPQALQRPDTAHLAWVSAVSFPAAVGMIACWGKVLGWQPKRVMAVIAAPVVLFLVVIAPFYPTRTYLDLAGQSAGIAVFGQPIRSGNRTFYFGDAGQSRDAQAVVDHLLREAQPGQRLIAGPDPLARTVYSDAFFYYLLPDLTPGTRFIEMDPGIADAEGSPLPAELEQTDWVILSRAWANWNEPNASVEQGSTEADGVLASRFCIALQTPTFTLYQACGPA